MLYSVKNYRAAYAWCKRWKSAPVTRWIEAEQLFESGDMKGSVPLYQEGFRKHGSHPAARYIRVRLVTALFRSGELEQALEELRPLGDRKVIEKSVLMLKAQIELALGGAVAATKTMRMCVKLFPKDPEALCLFVHSCMRAKIPVDDIKGVSRLVAEAKESVSIEDPKTVYLDTAFAHLEFCKGNAAVAERLLARVFATGTAPYYAYLLRGEVSIKQNRFLLARQQLSRAIRLGGGDPQPFVLIAKTYLSPHKDYRPDYALQLCEEACKLSCWKNPECIGMLVSTYQSMGKLAYANLYLEVLKGLSEDKQWELTYFKSGRDFSRRLKAVSNQ